MLLVRGLLTVNDILNKRLNLGIDCLSLVAKSAFMYYLVCSCLDTNINTDANLFHKDINASDIITFFKSFIIIPEISNGVRSACGSRRPRNVCASRLPINT